jgi:hypothetical protein
MSSLDHSVGLALRCRDYVGLAVPLDAVSQGQHLWMLMQMIPEKQWNNTITLVKWRSFSIHIRVMVLGRYHLA